MNQNTFFHSLLVAAASVCLAAGCGKKTPETAPEAPSNQPAASAPQSTPTATPSVAPTVSPKAQLAESQAALKAGDYERAANALIAAQQAHLDAQQAEAVAAQMRQLQTSLANAVASGDARAKAAAEKLRASATVR